MKNKIIYLIVFLLYINIVNAQEGTLEIDASTGNSWTGSAGGSGRAINLEYFFFYSTGYNHISKFEVTGGTNWVFPKDFDSSSFTIISGGTGNGYVTYNKTAKKIIWYYYNANITGNFRLSYDSNIWSGFSAGGGDGSGSSTTPTQPIKFSTTNWGYTLDCVGTYPCSNEIAQTSKSFTNNYNVSLIQGNLYNISIDKSMSSVSSKIYILMVNDSIYSVENAFNTTSFSYIIDFIYGIKLKMMDADGNYDTVILNSSYLSGIPETDYNLTFNKTFYNLGEQINLSWLLINPDITNYNYYIKEFDGNTILISTRNTNNALSGNWLPYHDKTIPQYFTFYITRSPKNNSALTEYLEMKQISYGITTDSQSGNFTTDKLSYNQSENIIITYNLSSSGRIHIFNYLNDYYYNLNSGNNIVYNYLVPQNEGLGNMYIELDYFDGNNYITLYNSVVQIKPLNQNNMIKFRDDSIEQGRIYYLDAYLNESGYILLTNPNGEIKFNFSISSNVLSNYNYQYTFNDIEGIYTGSLYNSSGTLIITDTNYLNSGIIKPKTTIPTTSGIDDNPFSFTDENGEVSDIMIKKRGNQWFSFFFGIAILLILIGVYWKAKGK